MVVVDELIMYGEIYWNDSLVLSVPAMLPEHHYIANNNKKYTYRRSPASLIFPLAILRKVVLSLRSYETLSLPFQIEKSELKVS